MKDLLRDSFIGQQINRFSRGRLLPYADQRPDYSIPERYLFSNAESDAKVSITSNRVKLLVTQRRYYVQISKDSPVATPATLNNLVHGSPLALNSSTLEIIDDELRNVEKSKDLETASARTLPVAIVDPFLVGWDGPNDQDNPK